MTKNQKSITLSRSDSTCYGLMYGLNRSFISLRVFGLLSSSLLLFPQRFGRYVLRHSSGVCRTWGLTRNFEPTSFIESRKMHQSTTPSLSLTIWLRWASRQFLTLPIVQTLLPVTFAYSLSSEAVVMRQLRRRKRLWRRSLTPSHKRTSMGA